MTKECRPASVHQYEAGDLKGLSVLKPPCNSRGGLKFYQTALENYDIPEHPQTLPGQHD